MEHGENMAGLLDNPRLFSTVRVGLLDLDSDEVTESIYDDAAQYLPEIVSTMAAFQTEQYPTNDLMHYFSLPDDPAMEAAIKAKVRSARPTTYAVNERLFAVLDLTMTADLTAKEYEAFKDQTVVHYADGWGGELEMSNIPTKSGGICLRLWHDEIEFYTASEFSSMFELQAQADPMDPTSGDLKFNFTNS